MKLLPLLTLPVAVATTALPAVAAESYILWDNFNNATSIDADRWLALERTRQVKDGVARFSQRDIGHQADNTSASFYSWGINLRDTGAVTQMRAVVTMTGYDLVGCNDNTSYSSLVQARVVGGFFSSSSASPTSRAGDVGAAVRLVRSSTSADPAGTVGVEGVVFKCTADDCQGSGVVAIGTVNLGTTTLNTAETLRVEWEPGSSLFNFQRGANPKQAVAYAEQNLGPPFARYRAIGTRSQVPSCFTGPRGQAQVSAKFDNFSVNASALP